MPVPGRPFLGWSGSEGPPLGQQAAGSSRGGGGGCTPVQAPFEADPGRLLSRASCYLYPFVELKDVGGGYIKINNRPILYLLSICTFDLVTTYLEIESKEKTILNPEKDLGPKTLTGKCRIMNLREQPP